MDCAPRSQIRLVALRAGRLGALHLWPVGMVPGTRLDVDFRRTLGLAALPLWSMGLRRQLWLVLDGPDVRLRTLGAFAGQLVRGTGMDRLGADGGWPSRNHAAARSSGASSTRGWPSGPCSSPRPVPACHGSDQCGSESAVDYAPDHEPDSAHGR